MPRRRKLGIPPKDRPGYNLYSESQKRYADEQYNLALIRRGLPIDHPIPEARDEFEGGGIEDVGPIEIDNIPTPRNQEEEISASPEQSLEEAFQEIIRGFDFNTPQEISGFVPNLYNMTGSLPGTAAMEVSSSGKRAREDSVESIDEAAGGGAGRGAPGPGSEGYIIPRPRITDNFSVRKYHKVHSILTYGIAPVIITRVNAAVYRVNSVTTSLAHIPVEYCPLYLSPAEWNLMEVGEEVIELKVKVFQRNIRVAFETNAATSTLATLNQNKTGAYAIGLNKQRDVIRRVQYTVLPADPMVPTALVQQTETQFLTEFVNNAYGVTLTGQQPSVGTNAIAFSQLGIPFATNGYATISSKTNAANSQQGIVGGIPPFASWIDRYDAVGKSGQMICEYTYKPDIGLLKAQPNPRHAGNYTGAAGAADATATFWTNRRAQQTGVETNWNSAPLLDIISAGQVIPAPTYTSLIEKSNAMTKGIRDHSMKVQPTLHVGVMPVPNLNHSNNTGWTDVQNYLDIECEMITRTRQRVAYPGPPAIEASGLPSTVFEYDIPDNDIYFINNSYAIGDLGSSKFGGLQGGNPGL